MDVGFFGKLFTHGDFLRRRASDAFVTPWDAWLQQCITASRSALGERWLELYLTSPAWRFACAPGVCGPAAVFGVMVPSVDRVGRYFPLTVVVETTADVGVLVAATEGRAFFDHAEQLVVETLAQEELDFDQFDAAVMRLAGTLAFLDRPASVTLDRTAAALLADEADQSGAAWQMPLGSVDELGSVWSQLLSHRLSTLYEPISMWWTDGSREVEPGCVIVKGLPHPETFKTFLDGAWSGDRWRTVPATIQASDPPEDGPLVAPALFATRSAGATDVGKARSVNQDAFLERPEIGLWVVADGLGGHTDGDVASQMVCHALADFSLSPGFADTIEGVRARMRDVNEHLLRLSARSLRGAKIGSTVVVLLIRGAECAALWAGDSRVYRLRDKRLEQLTVDHSAAPSLVGTRSLPSNVITRAVGVTPGLLIDVHRDEVRAGDRFLLCSDGLTRRVADDQIGAWMQHDDIDVCVEGLIQATLDAGAPDNVTVVTVHIDALNEDEG